MNKTPNIDALRQQLGLPAAPLVDKNLQVVANYFVSDLGISVFNWISYVRGIDFHKTVERILLMPGRQLVRHRPDDSKPKPFMYFADSGASPMRTGTNFPSNEVTFERYSLTRPVWALQSVASSISFDYKDHVSRPGGAVQYMIPSKDFHYVDRD